MCPSPWSLLCLTLCLMLGMKRGYSASRSWIPSQWWYWMSWSDLCDVLCLLEQTVTFQLISGSVYDIIHGLSGGCVVGALLQTIPTCHILRARLEGWLSQWGIQRPVWVFNFHQMRGSLCQLHLHLILIFSGSILLPGWWQKNLRILLGLLENKKHLDPHLQVSLKYCLLGSPCQPPCKTPTDYALGILQCTYLQFNLLTTIW